MSTLTNSVDPDEKPHGEAFHQGLHYLLTQKRSSEIKFLFCLKFEPHSDPSIYTMNHLKFIVSYQV